MKRNAIALHPEFPFRDGARDRRDAWEAGFLSAPGIETDHRRLLREFLVLIEQYAFLEKLIQGEIRYELPVHLESHLEWDRSLPREHGERLATAELELIQVSETPALELIDALDSMGIKTVVVGSVPPGPEIAGAFFFDGDTGPSILIGAPPDSEIAPFVAAHALGHLIADVNPYRSRFCRWDAASLENLEPTPEEVRADCFAAALLLPRSPLVENLERIAESDREHPEQAGNRLPILEALFGVPVPVLRRRLADLDLLDEDSLDVPAAQSDPSGRGGAPSPRGRARSSRGAARSPRGTDRSGRQTAPSPRGSGRTDRRGADRSVPQPIAPPRAASREPTGDDAPAPPELALPDRFVNLALAAYAERLMERDLLSRFLSLSEIETQQVIEWSRVPRRDTEDGSLQLGDPDTGETGGV